MKRSNFFLKTSKTQPAEETTANAKLLEQAGFVRKLMAGNYTYMPIGLRVLENIKQIVREEMSSVGGNELLMPMLHPKANWVTTGGWDSIDVLFKVKSRTDSEYALGQSEEEVVTPLIQSYVQTYRDLPLAVYQFGWKFRDELRAKSGVMRGREFLMKDMYSFHTSEGDFLRYYEEVKAAYLRIYERCGLKAKVTEASGGAFSKKISYEFMVLTDAGEDDVLYCENQPFCINEEIAGATKGLKAGDMYQGEVLLRARASEVGNVFDLGTKYSTDFGFSVNGEDGQKVFPHMGCYGVGISRLVGVITEAMHDERGLVWPENVAPFTVYLCSLRGGDEQALKLETELEAAGIATLLDDRDCGAGDKFADADLLGIPYRVVVSEKTLATGCVELKSRKGTDTELVPVGELISKLTAI